uniref:Sulfite exporter TauE/SafE family protein n=1 Tax=Aegilops tauschii subsp. strangulata TaxID=200361 RepID=A0A453KME6_AEGTS
KIANFMWQTDGNSYQHVWPPMEFGWKMVLGSLIGFFGASFGSVGGVGGGGIFVPMLTLIIGFDPKSSTAISKCMITGAAISTVYYNLKLKHPTLDMPVIDYDLALLIQPMLMLGISIGVIFNVIFPDWLVTVLLIILFLGTSTKAFLKGVETWKKETIIKREAEKRLEQTSEEPEYAPLSTGPGAAADVKPHSDEAPSLMKNIYWKEFGLLTFVWLAFLAIQITKNYAPTCSTWYWVLNFLQIPVSVGVTMYEALGLMNGKRVLSSKGNEQTTLKFHQLCIYCFFGVTAGLVGGLLGLGGGFIMGPLFLELGIPPQVHSTPQFSRLCMSTSYDLAITNASLTETIIGFKCYRHVCDDVLCFYVRRGILPLEPVSSSLCCLLCCCGVRCCHYRATCSQEVDQLVRAGITHHLHTGFHDLHQRNFSRYIFEHLTVP